MGIARDTPSHPRLVRRPLYHTAFRPLPPCAAWAWQMKAMLILEAQEEMYKLPGAKPGY